MPCKFSQFKAESEHVTQLSFFKLTRPKSGEGNFSESPHPWRRDWFPSGKAEGLFTKGLLHLLSLPASVRGVRGVRGVVFEIPPRRPVPLEIFLVFLIL